MIYDLPPVLSGSPQEQLQDLRDYLVRLAKRDQTETPQIVSGTVVQSASGASENQGLTAKQKTEVQNRFNTLRALIIKTANVVQQNIDLVSAELHMDYLALSDFGSYQENVQLQIEATAKQIVESYEYDAQLNAINTELGSMTSDVQSIRGEIRRGFISDPETGETAFGVAIAESLSFTGQTVERDGITYYTLSSGQTLGLYTATGWQFWINGSKRGWFDSRDSQLHVSELNAERGIQLGADWVMSAVGGFGLRYTGG